MVAGRCGATKVTSFNASEACFGALARIARAAFIPAAPDLMKFKVLAKIVLSPEANSGSTTMSPASNPRRSWSNLTNVTSFIELLRLNVVALHHVTPARQFGFDELPKFGRRSDGQLDTHRRHPLAHPGIAQHIRQIVVEARHDRVRRARRHEDSYPRRTAETLHAELVHGRRVG